MRQTAICMLYFGRLPHHAMRSSSLGWALALAAQVLAQQDPPPAPRGTIAGDYTGALRPQIHFSPPVNFMNDPNGMFVDAEGTWHLYYQCESCQNQSFRAILPALR